MAKVDFKRELKHLYNPSKKTFSIVDVPAMNFVMIDGQGDPNTSAAYQDAVAALYALAYALKFALKPTGLDYVVPPLEGLWWTADMAEFSLEDKDAWQWTMMIMQPSPVLLGQPPEVTPDLLEKTRAEVQRKKNLTALGKLRLESYHEGLAAQIMYLGVYADEGPTIAKLHAFIQEQGHEPAGKHHEIYLSDPHRTAPERLKTVIRQPIRKSQ